MPETEELPRGPDGPEPAPERPGGGTAGEESPDGSAGSTRPRRQLEYAIFSAFTAVLNGTGPEVLGQASRGILAAADEYAAALIERHASSPREQQDRRPQ